MPAVQSEKDGLSPLLFEDSPSSSTSLSGADGKAVVFGTSAEEAVREMRFRIEQKTSLTASAGEEWMFLMFCFTNVEEFVMAVIILEFLFCHMIPTDMRDLNENPQFMSEVSYIFSVVGIAPNMMLAKVCSDKKKPNGQYRIPSERKVVMDFMKDLPVRKVCLTSFPSCLEILCSFRESYY